MCFYPQKLLSVSSPSQVTITMNEFAALERFQEFMRNYEKIQSSIPHLCKNYKYALETMDSIRKRWCEEKDGVTRQIEDYEQKIAELEFQLKTARSMVDKEKSKANQALKLKDSLASQINLVRSLFETTCNDTIDPLEKLNTIKHRLNVDVTSDFNRLDTINEVTHTTDSVISDLSYTKDEDDFLNSPSPSSAKCNKRLSEVNTGPSKRRRTSRTFELNENEKLVATTTVTVETQGVIPNNENIQPSPRHNSCLYPMISIEHCAGDVLKDHRFGRIASEDNVLNPFSMNAINTRPHNFISKAMLKGETCNVCSKRMRFSSVEVKCVDCKTIAHSRCKDRVPLPCVANSNTPIRITKNGGTIADYTPSIPPMVPSLVIHCIKEIESRGLMEIGLYRVPGNDKEVKALKEKFLKGKGVPNLGEVYDTHAICGCLKEFLRSLKEPIVTQIRWNDFARACDIEDTEQKQSRLVQIISELPQPNRDTLSFIILHLKRVSEVPECKMNVKNLAQTFGPTIIGYSSKNETGNVFAETHRGIKAMEELISLPSEYFEHFLRESEKYAPSEVDMPKTPSSNSLRDFINTPKITLSRVRRRYIETP